MAVTWGITSDVYTPGAATMPQVPSFYAACSSIAAIPTTLVTSDVPSPSPHAMIDPLDGSACIVFACSSDKLQ